MSDLDDQDNESGILDFINDSIDALPDPISFLPRQLFAACGSGVCSEQADALHNPLDILFGENAQIFGYGLLERQFIVCRAPSSP